MSSSGNIHALQALKNFSSSTNSAVKDGASTEEKNLATSHIQKLRRALSNDEIKQDINTQRATSVNFDPRFLSHSHKHLPEVVNNVSSESHALSSTEENYIESGVENLKQAFAKFDTAMLASFERDFVSKNDMQAYDANRKKMSRVIKYQKENKPDDLSRSLKQINEGSLLNFLNPGVKHTVMDFASKIASGNALPENTKNSFQISDSEYAEVQAGLA